LLTAISAIQSVIKKNKKNHVLFILL
jgi:hypothetical protein